MRTTNELNKKTVGAGPVSAQNGITLIALVITIVVMLILVAVTISMAVNGGLFEYAGKAGTKTNEAIANEQDFANLEANMTVDELIDKYTHDNSESITIHKGDFVEYDVEYTDVYYDSYTYTSTNGWRLLNYTDNGDGTISNVELISTGVPAELYYYSTTYSSTGNNKWWITDSNKITAFQTALQNYYGDGTSSYTFYSNTGNNVYAAAGMYYNFGNIPFYTESNYNAITITSDKYNIGYYRSIEKNGTKITSNTDGSNLFLTSNDYSVRMLTLPEINNDRSASNSITSSASTISSTHEPAAGLYALENIKNISGLSSNTYSVRRYWLASPFVENSIAVCVVAYAGFNSDNTGGVRPVVNLGSDITYTVDSDTDETGITYLILTPEA